MSSVLISFVGLVWMFTGMIWLSSSEGVDRELFRGCAELLSGSFILGAGYISGAISSLKSCNKKHVEEK